MSPAAAKKNLNIDSLVSYAERSPVKRKINIHHNTMRPDTRKDDLWPRPLKQIQCNVHGADVTANSVIRLASLISLCLLRVCVCLFGGGGGGVISQVVTWWEGSLMGKRVRPS